MKKILIVCLGNICRSPMAEGVMRHMVEKAGLEWEIDSAGTGWWHIGQAPDQRAIRTALSHGIDISDLKARQFDETDFDRFDHIYVMDSTNYSDVLALSRNDNDRNKVKLFLEAADPSSGDKNVSDPWFDDALFDQVFLEIRQACEKLVEKLKNS